jgi:hypothetical protein
MLLMVFRETLTGRGSTLNDRRLVYSISVLNLHLSDHHFPFYLILQVANLNEKGDEQEESEKEEDAHGY